MKNTRRVPHPIPLVALALMALAVAGCAPKPTIVGKWQGVITQPSRTMNTLLEFTPDNKETMTVTAAGVPTSVVIQGTYAIDGANLTQTFTTMTIGGRAAPVPPNQAHPAPFTVDGDHLALSDPTGRQSMTLTRVKQ